MATAGFNKNRVNIHFINSFDCEKTHCTTGRNSRDLGLQQG